jgi:hypothetical protein
VWAHAQAYTPFFTDDGFISLRYTDRFLHGQGLTWNGDDRVEGYSNLLWVLLCAIPGLFKIDLVAGARALGLLCTAATFGAFVAAIRPTRPLHLVAPALGIALLAATDAIAVWSVGGLEPPLGGALLAWGVVLSIAAARDQNRRAAWGAAACFGLLCWTRPDGPLWAAVAAVALVAGYRKHALRVSATLVAAVVVFVGAQLAFRLAYYHDVFPNTAYAKVVINDKRLEAGLRHLIDSEFPLAATWLALITCGAWGLFRRPLRAATVLILALTVAWLLYVVRIGGDNFPAWRHLTYAVVLAGLSVSIVAGDDLRSGSASASVRWGVALVALAMLGTRFDPSNWAKQEVWQWDGQPVGNMLGRGFAKQQPLIAVDAAGTIPFYSKLPALDMLGLNDRYLAHHRPKNMGNSLIGHELGDGAYFLRRAPDIVCFGVPPCGHGAKFPAQFEMVRNPEFPRHYAALRFQARGGKPPLTAELWVRTDGRIGYERTPDAVVIPGYFFANQKSAVARLDPDGTFSTVINAGSTSTVAGVDLSPGAWTLRVRSPKGAASVRVTSRGTSLGDGASKTPLFFSVTEPASVDISIAGVAKGKFTMAGVELRKAGGS